VNQPQSETELEAIRRQVERGQPYGGDAGVGATVARLALESTLYAPATVPGTKMPKQKWTRRLHMPAPLNMLDPTTFYSSLAARLHGLPGSGRQHRELG